MLRFILSISILLIVTRVVSSQEVTRVKKNPLKNLYVAPSVGVEILDIKNYSTDNNGYSVIYKGVPSVKVGFDMNLKKSKKLEVHTGLYYSTKNFNRTENSKEGNTKYFYDQKFRNKYIETMIGGAYNFINGRFDVGCYSNMNFSCLVSAKETRLTETGNTFINNCKPSNNKLLSIFEPGLKFNYNINYRLSFGLKTGYRLYLNSITIDKIFTHNGVLVQSGLFYKF